MSRHHAPLPRLAAAAFVLLLAGASLCGAGEGDIQRRRDGRPDLSGTYDIATLTPWERPSHLGKQLALTDEEAEKIARNAERQFDFLNRASNPDRDAPPEGANVGGYNFFWIDAGDGAIKLDGKWRTSIVVDPPDGRLPPMTAEGAARTQARLDMWRRDLQEGEAGAWWLDFEIGPYDHPEQRPFGERCLLGFGSSAGPPIKPVLYNNLKRIVHTDDYVMILNEMNHDARIIRIGDDHLPPENRRWLGDSVGRWDGDTLVVETRNFRPGEAPLSTPDFNINFVTSDELRVVERFSRVDADTLRYHFTVDDPGTWTRPWSGEYPWPAVEDKVFEYACHEGNYALGNILRGARLAEGEVEP